MTKLLTILMSLQLIIAPVAFAAETTTTPPAETSGPPVAGDAEYETGMNSEGGYDFWTKQVMILAVGVLGANILTQCYTGYKTYSLVAYMLGSVTYILSEIAGAEAVNNRHKKNMSDLKMDENKMTRQGNEAQKKALEQKRDDEKASLEYIINKRNWMIAITSIWTAAMGIAIVEEIMGRSAQAAAKGDITKYNAIAKADCKAVGGPEILGINVLSLAIMAAWGFATSRIDGQGAISQYGSLIMGVLMMLSTTISKGVMMAYDLAWQRAITFGAHAALGGIVIGGLVQRQNAAEENIKKLEKVISEFEIMETPNTIDNEANVDGDGKGPNQAKKGKVARLAAGVKPTPKCMNAKREVSQAACGAPLVFKKQSTNLNGDLSTLGSALGYGTDAANGWTTNDPAKANVALGNLVNSAAKIRDITEKLKKKHNALLKSQGKKPIDWDKEIQKKLAVQQGQFNQAAAAKGFGPTTPIGRAALDPEVIKATESAKGEVEAPKGEGAAAEGDPELALEGEGVTEPEAVPETIAKAGEGIDKFETDEGDISKSKDVPIWTQLSNRYILNYTKIFDKKKEDTPPVTEAPVAGTPAAGEESVKK